MTTNTNTTAKTNTEATATIPNVRSRLLLATTALVVVQVIHLLDVLRYVEEASFPGVLADPLAAVGIGLATYALVMQRALGPGDALVLYTDGVTEARSGTKWFGDEGVTHALCSAPLESARDVADHLLGEALRFGGTTSADDIAVLVVKVPEGAT